MNLNIFLDKAVQVESSNSTAYYFDSPKEADDFYKFIRHEKIIATYVTERLGDRTKYGATLAKTEVAKLNQLAQSTLLTASSGSARISQNIPASIASVKVRAAEYAEKLKNIDLNDASGLKSLEHQAIFQRWSQYEIDTFKDALNAYSQSGSLSTPVTTTKWAPTDLYTEGPYEETGSVRKYFEEAQEPANMGNVQSTIGVLIENNVGLDFVETLKEALNFVRTLKE